MPMLPRRAMLAGLAATPLARPTLAQPRFPNRPIRLIVPWTAGGAADAHFRVLAEIASRPLGQPVVVENRPGANGTLGALALKQAPPDGYLVAQVHMGVLRVPLMQARPAYDPLTDFTYILHLTGSLLGIVVRADSPWQTLPDLVAYARANPGRISYGSLGVGSSQHLAMEQLGIIQDVRWTHVPYRGSSESVAALLGGHVDVVADSSAWAPMVEDGRLRLLVLFSSQRARRFPDVPTLRDIGIDHASDAAYGLAAPRGLDHGIRRTLHDAFKEALYDPAHQAALDRFYQPTLYMDGPGFEAAVGRYMAEETVILRRLGLYGTQQ